jgi:hypothetical protein
VQGLIDRPRLQAMNTMVTRRPAEVVIQALRGGEEVITGSW